tara:strand:- start:519 stop:728 length:210 start_codon:yes stop_codon:yes gene_type:complete
MPKSKTKKRELNVFHKIAAVIFTLIAALHLLRIFYKVDAVVGSWDVPMLLSSIAVVIAGILAVWFWQHS